MKYVNNTFHALKISFGNEIGNICAEMGIDSHKVMEIFCKDKQLNISPYYFKPGFAFGGSCLPKDLKGLQTLAHDLYVDVPVIDSINKSNELQITRAVEIIQHTGKKKIGFLGLSFKAGTDDLRNSPAVNVVETLLGKGYDVKIYDKNIYLSNLTGTNKAYIDRHIPHLSKLMVSDINELGKGVEVIVINNKEQEYLEVLEKVLDETIIVDMVRLPEAMRTKNNYLGINW
ncbi:MAG: UDP binding domain-containing protein, partial [Ferruginibacter sp.]